MLPIIILCTILSLAIADLPIHCLRSQILGRWKWELTRSFKDSHLSCGHPSHDSNLDELTNSDKYDFVSEDTLNLALSYPDRVTNLDNGDTGFFTMVFDEALEIRIGGQIIFAKFKYRLKDSDRDYVPPVTDLQSYESFCGETGTGWYHDESNENWGCARGLQYQSDHKQLLKPERSLLIRKTNFYNAESHVTTYEPDLKLIKSINSNPKSLWKAGVNEVFVGKSLFNIGHMLGRRRYHKPALFRSSKRIAREQDISVPESVDWRNVDSPIRNQGQCGSCYVFSTLAMLETRIRIAYPEKQFDDLHFSEQDVLACSRYNEGCEGGYPYLVAKYAHEFGAIGYDENRYIGYDSECPVRSRNDFNRRTRSSLSYRYVGGYFGACNEGAMMNEIALHGPIVTAIQVPSSLMVYKSGIFNDCPRVVKNDDGYEQSDHAVVIVGYGEEKGVKYWIIRNSWGEEYGEQGYFRLLRGVDACGVESAAVVTYV